jgi:2-furoate---CoA ligase
VNLARSLEYAAERHPEREAVVDGRVRLTFVELLDRTARLAGALTDLGLTRGERLAAVLRNRHETVCLYWAAQWLGATFVPLSWRASPADLDYCIEDSEARLVATEEDGIVHVGETAFPLLLEGDEHPGALDLDEQAPSLMLYTSGTTGKPKGVPRSHRADRAAGLSQVIQHGLNDGDRTLGSMPLYHTMGMHSLLAMSLAGGCFVVQDRWDAAQALELIEREQLTALYLAPTLYHDLVTRPDVARHDVSSVRALAYAGAAMTSSLVERCCEVFRPQIFVNHYGSTEIYTFSIHRDQRRKPGCAGRAALNARLRLGEDDEIECHLGSDEAFQGYWRRPDANEKAIRDGWYRTGDVGRIDEDGDLWVIGRVDDMIVSGGENIHPLEVEDVLARHAGVVEVAVVGAPDDRLGHRVVAVVVGTATEEELDAHCLASESLARFKRPREYRFVAALPKSPSGKILRRVLREEGVTA